MPLNIFLAFRVHVRNVLHLEMVAINYLGGFDMKMCVLHHIKLTNERSEDTFEMKIETIYCVVSEFFISILETLVSSSSLCTSRASLNGAIECYVVVSFSVECASKKFYA